MIILPIWLIITIFDELYYHQFLNDTLAATIVFGVCDFFLFSWVAESTYKGVAYQANSFIPCHSITTSCHTTGVYLLNLCQKYN